MNDFERQQLVKQKLNNLASGVKQMVERNQLDNDRIKRLRESQLKSKARQERLILREARENYLKEQTNERRERARRVSNVFGGVSKYFYALSKSGGKPKKNFKVANATYTRTKIWG